MRLVPRDHTKALVIAGLAGWFGVTLANQHPNRSFDLLRRYDRIGVLIPNWRFFAPIPGQHDYRLLHRVITADGQPGGWRVSVDIVPRKWHHGLWHPDRRRNKAAFDLCSAVTQFVERDSENLVDTPAFRLIRNHVAHVVRAEHREGPLPRGFQFTIAKDAGYDEAEEAEYVLVSPFVPLAPQGVT
jgi:hypothetical protein